MYNPDPKPHRERIARNTTKWKARVLECFTRDDFKCRACGLTKGFNSLAPHHIRSVGSGGGDDLNNLITLCGVPCHPMIHSGEIKKIYN